MDLQRREESDEARVKLVVRAPNQQIDDQTIPCKLEWTVARLKDHLAQVYPTKPERREQHIIYLGKVLDDTLILKDILRSDSDKEDDRLVVYLVCVGNSTLSSLDKPYSNDAAEEDNSRYATAESRPEQSVALQQYYSQLNKQQMAWMQQAYTYYLTRYMQIMAAQGIQVGSDPMYSQPVDVNARTIENACTNENTLFNEPNNAEDNEAAQGPDLAAGDEVFGGQQENADGGNNAPYNQNVPANEAAALNRDWLDIFDVFSRIIVLTSIVYYYSSLSRFLIVTFLGFAIYLIQGGFFRGQPAFVGENNNAAVIDNNNQMRQNGPVPPGDQIPGNARQVPHIPAATSEEQHRQAEATRTNVNEENERPGAWAFTWTFFSSFFASLIPDQPNVI